MVNSQSTSKKKIGEHSAARDGAKRRTAPEQRVRRNLNEYINQQWGQLYELEKDWGERAIRYLLLTNSGGAVATLSFLGASQKALNLLGAKIWLALFVLGIFFVGIAVAKTFHHMSGLFKAWKTDVENYHSDKITW